MIPDSISMSLFFAALKPINVFEILQLVKCGDEVEPPFIQVCLICKLYC